MKEPNPCNTKSGIATYLGSLTDLQRLNQDRRLARESGEALAEFCVLGRWYLDRSGNFSPILDEERRYGRSPASLGKCPPVMTEEELDLFMRGEPVTRCSDWPFPPAYATCSECGGGWTIADCHSFAKKQSHDEASLEPWLGKRLSDVAEIPSLKEKTWHRISRDSVYSDVYQGETRSGTSGKKWYRINADHVVQPGDRAMLTTMLFTHTACNRKRVNRESRAEMAATFFKAGFSQAQLISIPNKYSSHEGSAPWYTAQVDDLTPITIGWRKSVISIDWSETKRDLRHLFEGEDVTKERHLIHAWGYDKAAEYLAKILTALAKLEGE